MRMQPKKREAARRAEALPRPARLSMRREGGRMRKSQRTTRSRRAIHGPAIPPEITGASERSHAAARAVPQRDLADAAGFGNSSR
jgi:hypothetical protein